MKISSKEMKALIIVGSILVGIIYYQFGYISLTEKLVEKKQAKLKIETEYNKVMSDIQTLEERKSKAKVLLTKSIDKASNFYPQISQPKIIIELNEIMEKSDIKGNVQFTPIEVKEVTDITPNTPSLPNTSFNSVVDAINDKVTQASTGINNVGGVAAATVAGVTCEQVKVVITVSSASIESWNKFIKNLEAYDRKIVLNSLALTALNERDVTTTLTIELYAVPKINDVDKEYLNWDIKQSTTSSGLAFASGIIKNGGEVKNDFVAMLKPTVSEFATFRMGIANDENCESYIYDDKNDITEVELQVTEKEGKYYYKYKAGNSSMPINSSGDGTEFVPNADDIKFEIFSEARLGTEDKSGIKLKVINNTTKTVNVVVDGDAATNPRVDVSSEGGTVNIKK